jgi:hypothetical protein
MPGGARPRLAASSMTTVTVAEVPTQLFHALLISVDVVSTRCHSRKQSVETSLRPPEVNESA